MTNAPPLRAMMIGAHPDDCDISTYSITTRLVRAGCTVRFVSMTTGNAGHQTLRGKELAAVRAREAQASAALLGVTYEILPFDDGRLTPSLEARETLMRTIRRFQPDVIFTNRPCDYHPDHRATGQLVQDCAYLLGVPAICPDTPPLRYTPVILYWHDPFTDPKPFRPDFARPADGDRETLFQVECRHASQFLDWLPWADDRVDLAGKTEAERKAYLRRQFEADDGNVDDAVRACLRRQYGADSSDAAPVCGKLAGQRIRRRGRRCAPRAADRPVKGGYARAHCDHRIQRQREIDARRAARAIVRRAGAASRQRALAARLGGAGARGGKGRSCAPSSTGIKMLGHRRQLFRTLLRGAPRKGRPLIFLELQPLCLPAPRHKARAAVPRQNAAGHGRGLPRKDGP